jgi:hypothetical protein
MQRHRHRVGDLGVALDHFRKVAHSYRPGLFHAASRPDLPRTNHALEQLFGSQRYHERRATGRKTASPGAVLRGAVRLVAGIRTRAQAPSGRDLSRVDPGSIARDGRSCASPSTSDGRPALHEPASDAIPTPTSPLSNAKPNSWLCHPRKKPARRRDGDPSPAAGRHVHRAVVSGGGPRRPEEHATPPLAPAVAADPRRPRISAQPTPTSSEPSAPRRARVRASSCPDATRRR